VARSPTALFKLVSRAESPDLVCDRGRDFGASALFVLGLLTASGDAVLVPPFDAIHELTGEGVMRDVRGRDL